MGEYAHARSQLPQSLTEGMLQKREQRKWRLWEKAPKQQEKPIKDYLYKKKLKTSKDNK